jgi:hypothetical protein
MRPRHRWSMKVGKSRLPSRRKLLKLQPPSQGLARRRPLSERRDHRRHVQLLLKPKVPRLACLTSRPPSCKSRPPPRR